MRQAAVIGHARRVALAVSSFASVVVAFVYACGGQSGAAAVPTPVTAPYGALSDGGLPEAAQAAPPVTFSARVTTVAHQPLGGVVVVVEQLGQPGAPDGSISWNPNYRYGGVTDDAGIIQLTVPSGLVRLHAYRSGDYEAVGAPWSASVDAATDAGTLSLRPLPDGGASLRPIVSDFAAEPSSAPPGTPITFAVTVTAPDGATLSDQELLVEPEAGLAWGLAPPSAPSGGVSPAGTYGRVIVSPSMPGVYTYYFVAASNLGAPSDLVQVFLTVTGSDASSDASLDVDAGFSLDGGGLPDGRR